MKWDQHNWGGRGCSQISSFWCFEDLWWRCEFYSSHSRQSSAVIESKPWLDFRYLNLYSILLSPVHSSLKGTFCNTGDIKGIVHLELMKHYNYSPTCLFNPVWLSFYLGGGKEMFSRSLPAFFLTKELDGDQTLPSFKKHHSLSLYVKIVYCYSI